VRVISLQLEPVEQIRYLNASRRGGTEVCRLPVLRGVVEGLPEGLDAVVATSDLQGVVQSPGKPPELLGAAVARRCAELAVSAGLALASLVRRARGDHLRGSQREALRGGPILERPIDMLAVLAGDLYSVPDATRRGGYGDVASVWQAFAERYSWVVGVAGNHDDVGQLAVSERVRLLDLEEMSLRGLRVGGVGRVIGDPGKPGRREHEEQLSAIELVAEAGVDVLVLHEGPCGFDGSPGSEHVSAVLERHPVPLVICGHVHWPGPLSERGGRQILNVDGRAVILTRFTG
jgi:Icc protein